MLCIYFILSQFSRFDSKCSEIGVDAKDLFYLSQGAYLSQMLFDKTVRSSIPE